MATKQEVADWLSDRGWVFTEMTEAQKWEMRTALNVCGYATSSSNRQDPCPKPPAANGRCKTPGHGGAAKRGIAHPGYKHGKYSRYHPRRWTAVVERSMDDPGLQSLRRDLATAEAVINDLMHRIEDGAGTPAQHAELIGKARTLVAAIKSEDEELTNRVGPEVEMLLDQDFIEAPLRDELRDWLGLRKDLAEAESRRVQRLQQTETAESAERRVTSLGLAVRKNVRKLVERRWLTKDQGDKFLEWVVEDFLMISGPPMARRPNLSNGDSVG